MRVENTDNLPSRFLDSEESIDLLLRIHPEAGSGMKRVRYRDHPIDAIVGSTEDSTSLLRVAVFDVMEHRLNLTFREGDMSARHLIYPSFQPPSDPYSREILSTSDRCHEDSGQEMNVWKSLCIDIKKTGEFVVGSPVSFYAQICSVTTNPR